MGRIDDQAVTSGREPWQWRKKREIHLEAKKMCMRVLSTEPGMENPQPMNPNRLWPHFFLSSGRDLKIRTRPSGEAFWFAEWTNEAGEWYVCILALPGHTYTSALLDLCEVIAEVELGFRKPTRVKKRTPTKG